MYMYVLKRPRVWFSEWFLVVGYFNFRTLALEKNYHVMLWILNYVYHSTSVVFAVLNTVFLILAGSFIHICGSSNSTSVNCFQRLAKEP